MNDPVRVNHRSRRNALTQLWEEDAESLIAVTAFVLPVDYNQRMKINLAASFAQNQDERIAGFGDAWIVRKLNGRFKLIGGSLEDRRAAREWCSLFLAKAVFEGEALTRSCSTRELSE